MLFNVIIVAMLIAATCLASAESILIGEKSRIANARSTAASVTLTAAEAQALTAVRSQIQAGSTTIAIPTFSPVPLCPASTSCGYTSQVTYTVTGSTLPGDASTQGSSVTAINTQALANEGRITLGVLAQVYNGAKVVGTRQHLVTMQTMNASPYATIVGDLDTTGSSAVQTGGDLAGCDPSNPTACDVASTGPASDTRLNITSTCVGNAIECEYVIPPVSTFQNQQYNSTNASTGNFSR